MPTVGELARPDIAYHDANGRPLIGPCHVSGCPYMSLPGGGDAHVLGHVMPHGLGEPCYCRACIAARYRLEVAP